MTILKAAALATLLSAGGASAATVLTPSAVSLPASLPLILAGLGALGLIGRARCQRGQAA